MRKLQSIATQEKIQKAMTDLLLEKTYEEITIAEISKNSKISRTTFYLFYASKEELVQDLYFDFLEWYIEDVSHSYLADVDSSKNIIIKDFQQTKKDAKLLKALFRIRTGRFIPYMELQSAVETAIKENLPDTYVGAKAELAAKCYATNAVTTIEWWIYHCDDYTAEDMFEIININVNRGFANLLK